MGEARVCGAAASALKDWISVIVEEPPIHRMWPCSSSVNWPKESETSSSTLMDDDESGVEGRSVV